MMKLTEEQEMERCVLEIIKMTDELALEEFELGSPEFNFQQNMIKSTARYRLAQARYNEIYKTFDNQLEELKEESRN